MVALLRLVLVLRRSPLEAWPSSTGSKPKTRLKTSSTDSPNFPLLAISFHTSLETRTVRIFTLHSYIRCRVIYHKITSKHILVKDPVLALFSAQRVQPARRNRVVVTPTRFSSACRSRPGCGSRRCWRSRRRCPCHRRTIPDPQLRPAVSSSPSFPATAVFRPGLGRVFGGAYAASDAASEPTGMYSRRAPEDPPQVRHGTSLGSVAECQPWTGVPG